MTKASKSGTELIVVRASLPIETPDRFKQARHTSEISVAKMGVTIDFMLSIVLFELVFLLSLVNNCTYAAITINMSGATSVCRPSCLYST